MKWTWMLPAVSSITLIVFQCGKAQDANPGQRLTPQEIDFYTEPPTWRTSHAPETDPSWSR